MIQSANPLINEDDKTFFDANGYYIARGLLTPSEIEEIRETFQGLGDAGPIEGLQNSPKSGSDMKDPLVRYPRMMHPHRFQDLSVGPVALRYMLDARIESIVRVLMEEQPLAAQSMFYFKPAGARGQALHQDNFYLRVAPATCMAAWFAIDDVDEENGGLMVVPGSHTLDLLCPETADTDASFTTEKVSLPEGMEEEPAIMKAGDVLFFNGSLIHGSYPNESVDRYRRSLICHYAPVSSLEIGTMYKPLLDFNGQEVHEIAEAVGAGPCGSEVGG